MQSTLEYPSTLDPNKNSSLSPCSRGSQAKTAEGSDPLILVLRRPSVAIWPRESSTAGLEVS